MAGTRIGGLKAKQRNLEKDPLFYAKIGGKGGKRQVPKGFAVMDSEAHRKASAKGGAISRRGKATR